MQNHEFFQKSSAPFEKISRHLPWVRQTKPLNVGQMRSIIQSLRPKMQIDISQSAFLFCVVGLKQCHDTTPAPKVRGVGQGFPEASVAELWGFPVVAAGRDPVTQTK